ncbi:hypothetical protein BDV12DRAFT_188616 [Aspergillus spectabilis]
MNEASDEHASKRKRVRKGTHSCRECRRRKVKCTFASPNDATCIICRRRGTKCSSQGVAELTPGLPPTPASNTAAIADSTPHSEVTQKLLRALPHKTDIKILQGRISAISTFCYQSNFKNHNGTNEIPKEQIPMPTLLYPDSHPVLLARQMLLFVVALQRLPPNAVIPGLTEHHHLIMEELAESAIKLVTTNDTLLGTLEGLENIILEGFYHADSGNIRRAWITLRRAAMAAQLLGLHQACHCRFKAISDTNDLDPEVMWECIVSMERILSLLLDRDLITQTAHLPATFWRPLSFANLEIDSAAAFCGTGRAWDHMCYYTLVNQLHLPYILCPSHEPHAIYSRMACVNASREILTREIAIRTFNPMTACSRMGDFLALVAGMTLILAHLVSHSHKEVDKLLIHERLGDRATVEQALECMKSMSELNEDVLASKCAPLLKDLLAIEANVARGGATDPAADCSQCELVIKIPYIGAIRISREGDAKKDIEIESVEGKGRPAPGAAEGVTIGGIGSILLKTDRSVGDSVAEILAPPIIHAAPAAADPVLFPDAAASMDDWVFQGFDTAFFDVVMRGIEEQQLDGSGAGNGAGGGAEVQGWDLGTFS